MTDPIEARQDLPIRCSQCGCRIDKGDRFRILAWKSGGGFDYEHADCSQTSMKIHLRGEVA